eukprot:12974022-Heterocapsa_arctica.AAC.1
MDRLREREPLVPDDRQLEDVEAPSHVVAGEQYDLVVIDDGADVLVRERQVVEVADDHGLPGVGRRQVDDEAQQPIDSRGRRAMLDDAESAVGDPLPSDPGDVGL